MSESGGEKPKDSRKNVFSVVDKIGKQREEQERKIRDNFRIASDKIDHSIFDDPDRVRRKSLVIKAGKMLDTLRVDPALARDAIAAEREKLPQDAVAISDLIEHSTHEQCIREPNRFWTVLDIFFENLDKFAEMVVDQDSAEADITSRFKGKKLTGDEWVRAAAAQMDAQTDSLSMGSLSEKEPNFQELLLSMVEQVRIMETPDIVQLLDEYTRSELGSGAPYLLALVLEYKKRRTFSEKHS